MSDHFENLYLTTVRGEWILCTCVFLCICTYLCMCLVFGLCTRACTFLEPHVCLSDYVQVVIRGGTRVHSQLPDECDYLPRVLEFMAIIFVIIEISSALWTQKI